MMRTKFFYFLVAVMLFSVHLAGQDLHYSYYHYTPLDVNPANTGAFSGSYRVSGIYTNKGGALTNREFQNFTLSADAPIVRGIRKHDWIGVGIQADVINNLNGSGDRFLTDLNDPNKSAQNWTFIKLSAAYHLALNKKQTNIITLGAQLSNGKRSFPNFSVNDTRAGIVTNLDSDLNQLRQLSRGNTGDLKFTYRDISMGLLFNARRKTSDLRLGFALEGIFGPRIGTSSINTSKPDTVETKFLGLNIHGEYKMDINKRTSIIPAFYYYSLGAANAFNVNTHAWYKINPDKEFKGGVGLGVRNLRDVIVYLGAEMNDIQIGFAYDLNIDSRAIASNGLGGFEICARYLGKIYKKPKVKPIIFCPRL